ncbi:unnamed protein product [Aphanomyces euteiches]
MQQPKSPNVLLFDPKQHPTVTERRSTNADKPGTRLFDPMSIARTNFTSDRSTMDQSIPYVESDSPILGEHFSPHRVRKPLGHDFGPSVPKSNSMGILVGSFLGVGVGIGFYFLHPNKEVQKLLALPGNLFLSAFQCLVLPMVFCVMTVVVAEAFEMGRTSILRLRTLVPFFLTAVLATTQGLALALLFKPFFVGAPIVASARLSTFNMTIKCSNGLYLSSSNGTMGCVAASANSSDALFLAINQTIAKAGGGGLDGSAELSMVDQIIQITNLMVPINIFGAMVNGSLLSLVLFSIPFGYAIAKSSTDGTNYVLDLIRQVRNVFLFLLHKLLMITPVAVVFLMASAIGSMGSENVGEVMSNIGFFFLAFMTGVLVHSFLVLPLVLYLWTRANPYAYIKHLFPAYVFAYGCSSSMGTLPVAMACIQNTHVSRALIHMTMPYGTATNLNACGIYFPLALVFMANMSGLGDELTAPRYIIVFFASLFGCTGTAPVPHASLVYCLTLWSTCFPKIPLPASFAYLAAADFIIGRIRPMVNVNGNAIVTRILAEQVDEAFEIQAATQGQDSE